MGKGNDKDFTSIRAGKAVVGVKPSQLHAIKIFTDRLADELSAKAGVRVTVTAGSAAVFAVNEAMAKRGWTVEEPTGG